MESVNFSKVNSTSSRSFCENGGQFEYILNIDAPINAKIEGDFPKIYDVEKGEHELCILPSSPSEQKWELVLEIIPEKSIIEKLLDFLMFWK